MSFETNFGGVKTTVTDFQRVFTFSATGLKANTYYDVICESVVSNHCAVQRPTDDNSYSKTLKRVKNIELPTNIDLQASGLVNNGIYITQANLPLKSSNSGTINFEFDGSVWIRDGGKGSVTTSSGGGTTVSLDLLRTKFDLELSTTNVQFTFTEYEFNISGQVYSLTYFNTVSGAQGKRYSLKSIYQLFDKGTKNLVCGVWETTEGKLFFTGNFNRFGNAYGVGSAAGATQYVFNQLGLTYQKPPVVYIKFAAVAVPSAPTITSMNVHLRESNFVDPNPINPVPLGPPDPPVGWDTTKPEVPANTVTQTTLSSNTVTTSRDLGVLRTRKEFGTGGQTPLSEVSLYFDYAQTFYLDPAQLDGSQFVSLTGVNLYFKSKPHPKNNQSGIVNPGVYIFICEVENDIPNLRRALKESIVRRNYDEINASLNAIDFTQFLFRSPMPLKTGKSYAIVINFEDPQYSLWTATQGRKLIDSESICDSAYNFGKLFRASNYLEIDNDPKTQDDVLKAIPATDLKFDILALEFTDANGNLQKASIELVNDDYEFLQIENSYSKMFGYVNIFEAFGTRQYIYQDFGNSAANVFYYKPGTLTINLPALGTRGLYPEDEKLVAITGLRRFPSSLIVYGDGTNFTRDLDFGSVIVITDDIASDVLGYVANTCVRTVQRVVNNTLLILDAPCTFTSLNARYKVPVAAKMETAFSNPDTLVLIESNADEDKYFVSNAVNYITFSGGTGYQNTDYIVFSGANSRRNGRADITTFANGTIASINIVNTGHGFTTTPTSTIYTQNRVAGGSGTGASINVSIGGQIVAEFYGSKADIVNVTSFPINNFIPNLDFNLKGGTVTNTNINFAYLDTTANTFDLSDSNFTPVVSGQSTDITTFDGIVMSKSLEVLNREKLVRSTSEGKSSLIKFTLSADNKYDSPELHEELTSIFAFNNEINNDATDEHTNFGNATARHITKKITFDKDRFAEDIRVIITAYRPPGTDIKLYAKVHNSKDEDAFDDKTWTELEITDATFGGRLFSSKANKKDYIELTYGFKGWPDYTTTITGDAFVYSAAGNTTVTGVGTTFNTELANGDVIVLYDELFPNTTYGVAVVANTPVSTSFEINKAFANVSLEAATLKIGKADKPYMVFNDIQNDNVATYYSTSLNEFTTYDTFAVKIVLLSNSSYIVPRVNDIRAIGVSA